MYMCNYIRGGTQEYQVVDVYFSGNVNLIDRVCVGKRRRKVLDQHTTLVMKRTTRASAASIVFQCE